MPSHLTDFGLARLASTGSRYTRTGEALGTPAYMSPEQARGDVHALGAATDVWSLGCVLYELLAGRVPFEGDTSAAVIGRIITATPPGVRQIRPDIPADLDRVVRACLSKDARRRYADAGALQADLSRVLGGMPVRAPRARRLGALVGVASAVAVAVSTWAATGGWAPGRPVVSAAEVEAAARVARALASRTADPAGALDEVRAALRVAPGRHEWRVSEGLLCWVLGRHEEARIAYRSVPADASAYPQAILSLGVEAFARGDGDAAAAAMRPLLGRRDPEARLAAAMVFAAAEDWAKSRFHLAAWKGWEATLVRGYVEHHDPAGDPDLAEHEYARALAEGLPMPWILASRANLRAVRHDLAGARADYEAAIRLQPDFWAARVGALRAMDELGDEAAAKVAVDALLAERPDFDEARALRAKILLHRGEADAARQDLEQLVARRPDDAAAWLNLGLARKGLADLPGAEAALTHAIDSPAQGADALVARARVRCMAGDVDGARADADASVRVAPRNPAVWLGRADLHRHLEEADAAIADYGEALARDPDLALAWYSRGQLHYQREDFPAARADFDRYLKLVPDDADGRVTRAFLRHAMNDTAGALEDAMEAVRREPTLARGQRALGDFAFALGDRATAARAYREALRLEPNDDRSPELRAVLEDLARHSGR